MITRLSRRSLSGDLLVALGLLATCAAGLGCASDAPPASPPDEAPGPGEGPGSGGSGPGSGSSGPGSGGSGPGSGGSGPGSPGDGPGSPGECSGVTGEIAPLFPGATAAGAITTRSADGTITLEAAGRVRGRHEREAEFSPYQPRYFENRSYKFIIEDSIPAGGSTVKFTWLPNAKASDTNVINFRVWYTGEGNVFHANHGMERISSTHWEFVVERNARDSREIREGDRLEFEFGVFLDPATVEGRTSYYSDTFRYRVGSGELTPFDEPNEAALSGGDGTIPYIYEEPHLYYEQMALNIQESSIQRFLEGRRLFHTDFATGEHSESGNPAFAEQAGKAGPFFNQTACSGCHVNNGRGAPPEPGEAMTTAVVKLFGPEPGPDGAPSAHPDYGRQLQDKGPGGGAGEGTATVAYTEVPGQFPDGTPYVLRKPTFSFGALSAGEISRTSVRVARQLVGMGLLEAIPEETLLARADALDCDKDGISGRPNLIPDPASEVVRIGRFGWKAGKVSVPHQVADALSADMSVTTSLFPDEECGERQAGCEAGASGSPELSDDDLDRLAAYMRVLGVPPRRDTSDPAVQRGEVLFAQSGCVSCHVPSVRTGSNHPFAELRDQIIHPYSDLLLHDMGEELADGSARDHVAGPSEWRTPPLWGVGLLQTVNGHTQLLHDGRARSFVEAILWHGGEAAAARARFMMLAKEDRDALVAFLSSL